MDKGRSFRPPPEMAKEHGAYYTDRAIAVPLAGWAIRTSVDRVLDPSSGGGVFLDAALERLQLLGGDGEGVHGVELHEASFSATRTRLVAAGVPAGNLHCGEFFGFDLDRLPAMDAVIGNPPYIRFQRFKGELRQRALERAALQGVRLSAQASAWAPFLLHASAFLRTGGRLAMVLPEEIGHARYARPLLGFLQSRFACTRFVTFDRPLFPGLDQGTLILLAEGFDLPFEGLFLQHHGNGGPLDALAAIGSPEEAAGPRLQELDVPGLLDGTIRFGHYRLAPETRALYAHLTRHPDAVRLGRVVRPGLGYVTGANDFFHLTPEQVRKHGLPERYLRPAVFRSRALGGLTFTVEDWRDAVVEGSAGYLLVAPGGLGSELPPALKRYLDLGVRQGIHSGYKTRNRKPWYQVPGVTVPDFILPAMSDGSPRPVRNAAGVVASNTFLTIGCAPDPLTLIPSWLTSLTELSLELEGHPLGGGLLKLEPGEAARVLLVTPRSTTPGLSRFDRLLRRGAAEQAREEADALLLGPVLGLGPDEIGLLREGAQRLRDFRRPKGPSGIGGSGG